MKLGPEGKGWRYVIILILIVAALFGIQTCSDSSMYTLNGEKFNRIVFIPIAVIAVGVLIYFVIRQNKK